MRMFPTKCEGGDVVACGGDASGPHKFDAQGSSGVCSRCSSDVGK